MQSLMQTSGSFNRYNDSERRFQHVLEACGVFKSLRKLGVKEGDTVIVGEVCLSFLMSISVHCNHFFISLFIVILACMMNEDVSIWLIY